MTDVIVLGQISECFDKGWTITDDDFAECTPSTEYVFEYPIAFCLSSFCVKCVVLREVGERTATLY